MRCSSTGWVLQFTQATNKQIYTFWKVVTAHIWDFGILADKNKFQEAMQRGTLSRWSLYQHVGERKDGVLEGAQMCSHLRADTEAHTSCIYCTRLCVDLIVSLLFFPLVLCLSVCQAICVYFPFMAPCLLPPSFDAIYRNDSCLKILHPVLCVPGFIGCFLMGSGGPSSWRVVRENGSWFNEKIRTISLIGPQQVCGEINLHEDCFKALILSTVNNCERTASEDVAGAEGATL